MDLITHSGQSFRLCAYEYLKCIYVSIKLSFKISEIFFENGIFLKLL